MKHSTLTIIRLGLACLFIDLCSFLPASAQWSTSYLENNPVCTDEHEQSAPRIASDGSGGAIIAWWDYDPASNDRNIYAQRIDSSGVIRWDPRGIVICTNNAHQQNPEMASDGEGGAIIVWFDSRNTKNEIFAQKVNSSGVVQWTADGMSVGTVETHYQHSSPAVTGDGNGGAIIAWDDWRKVDNEDQRTICATRISKEGVNLWGSGGIRMHNVTPGSTSATQIISDGNGGAIICWDKWDGTYPAGNRNIYAQRVTADGGLLWGESGLAICTEPSEQRFPFLAGDGSGGAYLAWEDRRLGKSYNTLYAQRINPEGMIQWDTDGIPVAPIELGQKNQRLASDGEGGVYIAWQFYVNKVYVKHFDASGNSQWPNDGICVRYRGDHVEPMLVEDGQNGVIITWLDFGIGSGDVFAQRMNKQGELLWTDNAVWVSGLTSSQLGPRLADDGEGNVIITWEDQRNMSTNSSDIYAQRVAANGTLGLATGIDNMKVTSKNGFSLGQNFPNPFKGNTEIEIFAPYPEFITVKVFNMLGKEVSTLVNRNMEHGNHTITFDAGKLPGGVYYYRLEAGDLMISRSMIIME